MSVSNTLRRLAFTLITLAASTLVAGAQQPASIEVQAGKLENTKGVVWFCLWKEGQVEGFPRCDKGKPVMRLSAPAGSAKITFSGITPGAYAVSIFHDEKQTGIPDTNMLGMPLSPIGLSNNPSVGITSPPTFDKAKFVVQSTTKIVIDAKRVF